MAKFSLELPTEIMNDIQKIYSNADQIFGEMTQAGAETARDNIVASKPDWLPASAIKITKPYKTPSDDGISSKVYVSGVSNEGYSWKRRGRPNGNREQYGYRGIPFEFLVMIQEYGTSPRFTNSGAYRGYRGKKPFFRKGFSKSQIEAAMLKVQRIESGGLLDE